MAHTSMKRLGYVTEPVAREMVMLPSSSGWRIVSSTAGENSGSSSRKSTPRWASEMAPGRATLAPRLGMTAEVPPLRKVPNLTMKDMGMGGMDHGTMDHGGMNHGAMGGAAGSMSGMDHAAMGHGAGTGAACWR